MDCTTLEEWKSEGKHTKAGGAEIRCGSPHRAPKFGSASWPEQQRGNDLNGVNCSINFTAKITDTIIVLISNIWVIYVRS